MIHGNFHSLILWNKFLYNFFLNHDVDNESKNINKLILHNFNNQKYIFYNFLKYIFLSYLF